MVAAAVVEISSSLHWDDLKLDVERDMLDLDDAWAVENLHPLHDWHCCHWEAVEAAAKAEDKTDLTHYSDCSPCQVEHNEVLVFDADVDYGILETDVTVVAVEHVETDRQFQALEINVVPVEDHGAGIEGVNLISKN